MYKKILIPVDLTEPAFATRALDAVKRAIADPETHFRFISVMQITPVMMGEYLPADFDVRAQEDANKKLLEIAAASGIPAARVTHVIKSGGVTHEVNAEAKAWGADLVVVGSHRPSMATYLLGSSATSIVRHAPCSVLVVR